MHAYTFRGVTWLHKKDYDQAIQDFDQAIRLNPKHAYAYYRRGYARSRRHDHEKAIKDYEEAIRFDPNYAPVYRARGDAWLNMKDYDRAIQDFNQAIRLAPREAHYYACRGDAWLQKKQFDMAIQDFDGLWACWPSATTACQSRNIDWEAAAGYKQRLTAAGCPVRCPCPPSSPPTAIDFQRYILSFLLLTTKALNKRPIKIVRNAYYVRTIT